MLELQVEQKLVHSFADLEVFKKVEVAWPLTSSQVPTALDAIGARKEYFLAERAKVCPFHSILLQCNSTRSQSSG